MGLRVCEFVCVCVLDQRGISWIVVTSTSPVPGRLLDSDPPDQVKALCYRAVWLNEKTGKGGNDHFHCPTVKVRGRSHQKWHNIKQLLNATRVLQEVEAEMRLCCLKQLGQGHTADKWQGQNASPGLHDLNSMLWSGGRRQQRGSSTQKQTSTQPIRILLRPSHTLCLWVVEWLLARPPWWLHLTTLYCVFESC